MHKNKKNGYLLQLMKYNEIDEKKFVVKEKRLCENVIPFIHFM